MTRTIEAALIERQLLETEQKGLAKVLQDDNYASDYNEPHLSELQRKCVLLRMAVNRQGIKWLDALLVDEIVSKPELISIPTQITANGDF